MKEKLAIYMFNYRSLSKEVGKEKKNICKLACHEGSLLKVTIGGDFYVYSITGKMQSAILCKKSPCELLKN